MINGSGSRSEFFVSFLEPVPTESPYGACPTGFDDLGHNEFCYTAQVIFLNDIILCLDQPFLNVID